MILSLIRDVSVPPPSPSLFGGRKIREQKQMPRPHVVDPSASFLPRPGPHLLQAASAPAVDQGPARSSCLFAWVLPPPACEGGERTCNSQTSAWWVLFLGDSDPSTPAAAPLIASSAALTPLAQAS